MGCRWPPSRADVSYIEEQSSALDDARKRESRWLHSGPNMNPLFRVFEVAWTRWQPKSPTSLPKTVQNFGERYRSYRSPSHPHRLGDRSMRHSGLSHLATRGSPSPFGAWLFLMLLTRHPPRRFDRSELCLPSLRPRDCTGRRRRRRHK